MQHTFGGLRKPPNINEIAALRAEGARVIDANKKAIAELAAYFF